MASNRLSKAELTAALVALGYALEEFQTSHSANYPSFIRYTKGIVFSDLKYVLFPTDKFKNLSVHSQEPRHFNTMIHREDRTICACLSLIKGYLNARGLKLAAEGHLVGHWTKENVGEDTIPRQLDSTRCGLFVCALADVLTRTGTFGGWGYSLKDMPRFLMLLHCLIRSLL